MAPHITAFLRHLQIHNASVHTQINYQRDLQAFLGFYLTYSKNVNAVEPLNQVYSLDLSEFNDWSHIQTTAVRAFLAHRMAQGISARTVARQLSALRAFYNFLLLNEQVTINPVKGLKAPKQGKPLPKSLDVDWTQTLLEQPLTTWQTVRDQAIFELLYSAGLRVSECTQLNLLPGLAMLDAGWVQVLGKGQKHRLAPVGSKALSALQAWLAIRPAHAKPDEPAVFVSSRGTRLGVRSVQLSLDKRTVQAGLPTKMSPHRLRHACATHVLESSGDLRAVQEILGHANLSTTQIYTKLDLQHLAHVYDLAHPRAKKPSTQSLDE